MFDFSNYSTKPKYYDNSNKLVVGKMKDETAGVAIKEFVGLKPNMYSYFVDDNNEHKNAKGVIVAIIHNEYKDVLLNKKCLRYSMNSIQSKSHRIGTMRSTRFLCLDLMVKYTSKTMDVMHSSWLLKLIIKKTVTLTTIQKSFFVKHIALIFFLVRTAFMSSKLL